MKKTIITASICVFSLISTQVFAQSTTLKLPRVSQSSLVEQQIGITKIKIDYSRPAVKERKVWGQLVPYDNGNPFPWRAGANENTVFSTSTEIKVGGKTLPAGTYGLHLIVSEDDVDVIFNSNSTSWGSYSYNAQKDVLKTKGKLKDMGYSVEFLTYNFSNLTVDGGDLELQWGDKKVVVEVKVNTNQLVIESIKNQLQTQAGWTWLGWHEAANYTLQNEYEMKQGLQWAGRSVGIQANSRNMLLFARLDAKVNHPEEKEEQAMVNRLETILNNQSVSWKEWNAVASFCLNNNVALEKGLAFANQSVAMNPKMGNQMNKAMLLSELGKEGEAKSLKEKVLADATNAEINTYAYSLLYGGKGKESLEFFIANTKKNPKDPNVFDSLGEAYFRNGKMEEAKKAFKTSLSLNPPANVKANTMNFLNQMGVDVQKL